MAPRHTLGYNLINDKRNPWHWHMWTSISVNTCDRFSYHDVQLLYIHSLFWNTAQWLFARWWFYINHITKLINHFNAVLVLPSFSDSTIVLRGLNHVGSCGKSGRALITQKDKKPRIKFCYRLGVSQGGLISQFTSVVPV